MFAIIGSSTLAPVAKTTTTSSSSSSSSLARRRRFPVRCSAASRGLVSSSTGNVVATKPTTTTTTTTSDVARALDDDNNEKKKSSSSVLGAAATAAVFFQAQASPALASAAENAVPSALAAYGHYLGLFLIVGALATEKAVLKPNMSGDELMKLVIADSVYGLAGVLVLYTGYLRVTQYGKGWEFYSHEPIFWFKMFLFAVMGSSSLFVTIKTITTFAAKQKSTDENETYISEKLATRMGKVLNGELLAVLAIPLAATTMSRGILFQQEMDWRLGAVPVALASAGLGFKYVKEAVTWSED
tara:strand:+ start:869 stop:1768 length:900 start_codon:yes stop_codon:yes gene_type:complete